MLFCDVAQNYLEQDKENLAPLTVRTYYWNLKKIRDYDPSLDCSDVNEQMVRNYRRHLQQKGNKPNTIIKALSVLRNFSKKMLIDGLITENPFSRIRIGQVYTPRSYLTTSELKKLYLNFQDRLHRSWKEGFFLGRIFIYRIRLRGRRCYMDCQGQAQIG